jgi:hypothetical protein
VRGGISALALLAIVSSATVRGGISALGSLDIVSSTTVRRGISVLAAALALLAIAPAAQADPWYSAALVRKSVEPPYRTQLDDSMYARSDCGPAVLGMVLDDYGIDQDTLELRQLTHTYQGTWPAVRVGTALQHIAHVAEDFGLNSYGLYDDPSADAFHA